MQGAAIDRRGAVALALALAGLVLAVIAARGTGHEPASAASHREAPLISLDGPVDISDFFMFRSYEPGNQDKVVLVATSTRARSRAPAPTTTTSTRASPTRSTSTTTGTAGGRRQLRVQVPHRDPRDRRRRRSVPLVPRRRGTVCTDHGPRRAGLGGPRPAAALRRDDGQRPPPHADRTWPDRRAVECRARGRCPTTKRSRRRASTSRSPASRSSPDSGRTRSTSTSAACSTPTSAGRSRPDGRGGCERRREPVRRRHALRVQRLDDRARGARDDDHGRLVHDPRLWRHWSPMQVADRLGLGRGHGDGVTQIQRLANPCRSTRRSSAPRTRTSGTRGAQQEQRFRDYYLNPRLALSLQLVFGVPAATTDREDLVNLLLKYQPSNTRLLGASRLNLGGADPLAAQRRMTVLADTPVRRLAQRPAAEGRRDRHRRARRRRPNYVGRALRRRQHGRPGSRRASRSSTPADGRNRDSTTTRSEM